MPAKKRQSCARCHAEPRFFNELGVICTGVAVGTRCASCRHDRTMGHGPDGAHPCTVCACPELVREEPTP